jgi:NTE family protein
MPTPVRAHHEKPRARPSSVSPFCCRAAAHWLPIKRVFTRRWRKRTRTRTNAPESRVERLRQFWQLITEPVPRTIRALTAGAGTGKDAPDGGIWSFWEQLSSSAFKGQPYDLASRMVKGDVARSIPNHLNAARTVMMGAAGFFAPRVPGPWLWPAGSLEATSFYDTGLLKTTLQRLVDFDRINTGEMRFSVGAVNVGTGNLVYFDTASHVIRPIPPWITLMS